MLPRNEHDEFQAVSLSDNQPCEDTKDLQPLKQRTYAEIHTAHKNVLPSIELDTSEREAPVGSTKIAKNFVLI